MTRRARRVTALLSSVQGDPLNALLIAALTLAQLIVGGLPAEPPEQLEPLHEHVLLLEGPQPEVLSPDRELLFIREATADFEGWELAPPPAPEPAPELAQSAQVDEPARDEAPEAPTTSEAEPASTTSVWDRLADCESGNWVNGGESFEPGSARWDWAKDGQVPPWGTTIHHGGLQFHPGTWASFKLDGYPQYAYDATREQQIAVAERVLAAQGWGAWPTCARKLGLR